GGTTGQQQAATNRQRIASEALAGGEIRIPSFTISEKLGDDLLGGEAAKIQQSIDTALKPASRDIAGARAEMKIAVAERRQAASANVVGLIEGSDPQLKNETIVFSGHFDHDGVGPNGILHGADDNGSGTVGVVVLARAFAKNDVKPRRS